MPYPRLCAKQRSHGSRTNRAPYQTNSLKCFRRSRICGSHVGARKISFLEIKSRWIGKRQYAKDQSPLNVEPKAKLLGCSNILANLQNNRTNVIALRDLCILPILRRFLWWKLRETWGGEVNHVPKYDTLPNYERITGKSNNQMLKSNKYQMQTTSEQKIEIKRNRQNKKHVKRNKIFSSAQERIPALFQMQLATSCSQDLIFLWTFLRPWFQPIEF